jgi:flagellar hook assembly protein FlgD
VKLRKTSRLVLKIRGKGGKVVRTIRVPKRKAGTTVRVRWDGKDARGRYVSAGTYAYTLTAVGSHYLRTARGSVAVLAAG